jgi:hypothetical protein
VENPEVKTLEDHPLTKWILNGATAEGETAFSRALSIIVELRDRVKALEAKLGASESN